MCGQDYLVEILKPTIKVMFKEKRPIDVCRQGQGWKELEGWRSSRCLS
jgi:hypothetical protein